MFSGRQAFPVGALLLTTESEQDEGGRYGEIPTFSFAGPANQTRRNSGIDFLGENAQTNSCKNLRLQLSSRRSYLRTFGSSPVRGFPSDAVEASRALQDQVNEGRSI